MRDERDEVGPQRGEAPQLGHRPLLDLVQPLGLVGPRLGPGGLDREAPHEPADDQRHHHLEAGLEGDELPAVGGMELVGAELRKEGEDRRRDQRDDEAAGDPEADAGRRQVDVEDLLDRQAELEGEDEDVGGDDRRIEDLGREALGELVLGGQPRPCEDEEEDRAGREEHRRHPRPDLPAGWVVLGERDEDDDEREGDQPDERDPALDAPQLHVAPSRSSAQRACSARSASSPSACRRSAASAAGSSPPVFPSATIAFRRSQRGSFRGT